MWSVKRVHYHLAVDAFKDFAGFSFEDWFVNQLDNMFAKTAGWGLPRVCNRLFYHSGTPCIIALVAAFE